MRAYFRDELLLMLDRAGFEDVVVRGDYTDAEPTADNDFLVFIAHTPRLTAPSQPRPAISQTIHS